MDTFKNSDNAPEPEEELSIESEENAVAFEERFQKLREKLKRCESDRAEYLAGWQRAKADFLNARKEEEKQRTRAQELAEMMLLRELIPLLDSFQLALAQTKQREQKNEQWFKGIEGIYGQLQQILEQHNVHMFTAKGRPFDPNIHEALGVINTDREDEHQIVLEELQPGYIINERLLRPAKVKVGEWKKNKEHS